MSRRRAQPQMLPGFAEVESRRPWRGAVHRSRTSKGPPPAPRPWEAYVIGVDTARRSGWSRWARGKVRASGELDTLDESAIAAVLTDGLREAAELGLPCVLVLEKAYGGSVAVVMALGAAAERWLAVWRKLAKPYGHVGKVERVAISTWRSAVLGPSSVGLERDEVRPVEQRVARAILQLPLGAMIGGDEAPGVCIGFWGTRAGEVGELLGKRSRKASLNAWLGKDGAHA